MEFVIKKSCKIGQIGEMKHKHHLHIFLGIWLIFTFFKHCDHLSYLIWNALLRSSPGLSRLGATKRINFKFQAENTNLKLWNATNEIERDKFSVASYLAHAVPKRTHFFLVTLFRYHGCSSTLGNWFSVASFFYEHHFFEKSSGRQPIS